MDNLTLQIHGLLFAQAAPMSRAELAEATGASAENVERSLEQIKKIQSGIVLVDDGSGVELRAAAAAAEVIERVRREAFSRSIGRAGLEVVAALLYRGALTRAEVDFLRGVNSSQTLRTLAARGLVRKISNPKDERSFLYEATGELLASLGAVHMSDVPEYADMHKKLIDLEEAHREQA